MTFDSIITIFALFIAIYAILPKYRRINIFLKFGILHWIVLILALLLVHYLQFYQTFVTLNLNLNWGLNKYNLTPQNVSYLIILFSSIFISLHLRFTPLPKNKVKKLQNLTNELMRTQQYTELISLVEKNLARLKKISAGNFFLARKKKQWTPQPYYEIITEQIKNPKQEKGKSKNNKLGKLLKKFTTIIAKYLPDYQRNKNDAHELFRNLLYSEKFINAIKDIRPYFSLNILNLEIYERSHFVDKYLTVLYNDNSSILYSELENNQNLSSYHLYDLPESNKLLNYLFSDARIAEKLGVWRPVGEAVIIELDNLSRTPSNDYYNLAMDDFFDKSKWKSSLFIGVFFFDVMVSSALHQGITWHMWLYYYPHFMDRIVRNYNPNDKLIDIYAEWPTKYNYLMYEIISACCDWIISIRDLPLDQENIKLDSTNASYNNGNIPKSSILALGSCIYTILTSDKITEHFKNYIMDIVYRLYFDLRNIPALLDYSVVLRNAVKQGGSYKRSNSDYYQSELVRTFRNHDDKLHYKREDVDELENFFTS